MERAVSHRNGLPHDSEESFKRVASTSRRRVLDTSHQCVDSESSRVAVGQTQNVPPLVFQFLFQIPHNCCVFYSIQSSHIVIIICHGRASAGIETVRTTVVSFHRSLFFFVFFTRPAFI